MTVPSLMSSIDILFVMSEKKMRKNYWTYEPMQILERTDANLEKNTITKHAKHAKV